MLHIVKRVLLRRLIFVTAIIAVAAVVVVVWKRHDIERSVERAGLPDAIPYQGLSAATPSPSTLAGTSRTTTPTPKVAAAPKTASLPAEINLAVPFTPQAPHAQWQPPYKEFCEEASVLMTVSYLRGEAIAGAADADQKMLTIKGFEETRFGYYEDTTAAETAVILREFYKMPNVTLAENPSVLQIKEALAAGKLVILPAAGRLLGNPYYTPPGPLYHMLVIKGYTAEGKFITNDPGTRRGADFLYSSATIMNAMHDWRADGNVELGRKVVIIVG